MMNMNARQLLCGALVPFAGMLVQPVDAQLPTNFPAVTVSTYDSNHVAAGYLFLASWTLTPGAGSFLMILDNHGTPVDGNKYKQLSHVAGDFKVQPNGLLSYADTFSAFPYTGGWDVNHRVVAEDLTTAVETVQMKNGYLAEFHDFQLQPNGHALAFGYYLSEVDMSQIVSGGHPAALVSGAVIQELDAQRKAVWQWRSWDHYDFEAHTYANPTAAMLSEFHINDLRMDFDGNLIAGTPTEVRKINRQTGEVMWTLGGIDNDFTIVGGNASHFGGHTAHRIENGNLLIYNNAVGTNTSQVHEYSLDETNLIATRVWSYVPPTKISAWATGGAQRLSNGNTLICWGLPRNGGVPTCTEVTPSGQVVFELSFNDPSILSYRAFRFPFPSASQKIEHTVIEVSQGSHYDFGDTGVSIDVQSLMGGGYNQVTATREPYAPILPSFVAKAPRVLPVRVKLAGNGISSMTHKILFDANSFGFNNPSNLTVYHRQTPGTGLFVALPTDPYNPVTQQVRATATGFGEFILGYPDLADVALPPILNRPENYRGLQTNNIVAARKAESGVIYSVNQERPVYLSWSPKGFARYYELQVDPNPAFTNPVIDLQYRTDAGYVWSNALPNTTYHWRVRTMIDDFSTGAWSTNTLQTVPPAIEVTAPNGGERWQRGLSYFVQWDSNLGGDVVIDLYKGGSFLQNLVSNPGSRAYKWDVNLALDPGSDYSIRIAAATNSALFDLSDGHFSVDVPRITKLSASGGGSVGLEWLGASFNVFVEFAPAVSPGTWTNIAGPINQTNWTGAASPSPRGFYRLRVQ